jgi:hypothetical protein
MRFYDIYNGDADGICALLQLRFAEPRDAQLITGVKRDIRLLEKVQPEAGDCLTVLDISLDANRASLQRVLEGGALIEWFDHHHAGEIPAHPRLRVHIDTDPALCTSLIVDRYLEGRFRAWAIVAAFGDNLDVPARALAGELQLKTGQVQLLRELGICINYNAYGETLADLRYTPQALFQRLKQYRNPLDFIESGPEFQALKAAYAADLEQARSYPTKQVSPGSAILTLPDESWSRRVVGVLANQLAQRFPHRAHAILVKRAGGYLVSLRAPLSQPRHAQAVAGSFASGGGREAAAGIEHLPDAEVPRLVDLLRKTYPG